MIIRILTKYDFNGEKEEKPTTTEQIVQSLISEAFRRAINQNSKSIREIFQFITTCTFDRKILDFSNMKSEIRLPDDIEKDKKGNNFELCLWVWRQLSQLKIPSRLVIGKIKGSGPLSKKIMSKKHLDDFQSVWLTIEKDNKKYICDPTSASSGLNLPSYMALLYHPELSFLPSSVDHPSESNIYHHKDLSPQQQFSFRLGFRFIAELLISLARFPRRYIR